MFEIFKMICLCGHTCTWAHCGVRGQLAGVTTLYPGDPGDRTPVVRLGRKHTDPFHQLFKETFGLDSLPKL